MADKMKPTVIAANQAGNNGGNTGNGSPAGAGINIPINREYVAAGSPQQHYAPHQQQQQPHQFYNSQPAYGSPRQQQQQQQHHQQVPPNQQQQHFQVGDWLKSVPRSRLLICSLTHAHTLALTLVFVNRRPTRSHCIVVVFRVYNGNLICSKKCEKSEQLSGPTKRILQKAGFSHSLECFQIQYTKCGAFVA